MLHLDHVAHGQDIGVAGPQAVVDGKAATAVRFSKPGAYVVRAYADDGILLDYADIAVTVR